MTHSAQASFSTWCLEEGASNEEQSEPKKKVSFERQIGQWSPLNLTFVEQAPKICRFFVFQLDQPTRRLCNECVVARLLADSQKVPLKIWPSISLKMPMRSMSHSL